MQTTDLIKYTNKQVKVTLNNGKEISSRIVYIDTFENTVDFEDGRSVASSFIKEILNGENNTIEQKNTQKEAEKIIIKEEKKEINPIILQKLIKLETTFDTEIKNISFSFEKPVISNQLPEVFKDFDVTGRSSEEAKLWGKITNQYKNSEKIGLNESTLFSLINHSKELAESPRLSKYSYFYELNGYFYFLSNDFEKSTESYVNACKSENNTQKDWQNLIYLSNQIKNNELTLFSLENLFLKVDINTQYEKYWYKLVALVIHFSSYDIFDNIIKIKNLSTQDYSKLFESVCYILLKKGQKKIVETLFVEASKDDVDFKFLVLEGLNILPEKTNSSYVDFKLEWNKPKIKVQNQVKIVDQDYINNLKIIPKNTIKSIEKNIRPDTVIENIEFNKIHKKVLELQRSREFDTALKLIDSELNKELDNDLKSKYLQIKSQLFSVWGKYEKAEQTYLELIKVNKNREYEKKDINLSHLLLETARIQKKIGKIKEAKNTIKQSLNYNRSNKSAIEFLANIDVVNNTSTNIVSITNTEDLSIQTTQNDNAISRMLLIDLQECEYRDEEIIKLGGKPDILAAERLLEQAKQTTKTDLDLSERYPIYLESAKAFNDLPIGSNVDEQLRECLSFYATLKGNSLFLKFKKEVLEGNKNFIYLARLKDSACSYYIQSLNLQLNNIKSTPSILANYLKLQISFYQLKNGQDISQSFSGAFDKVFDVCLESKNEEVNKILYDTIFACGAESNLIWNNLTEIPKMQSFIYKFKDLAFRAKFYAKIARFEKIEVSPEIKTRDFFVKIFENRRNRNNAFQKAIQSLEKTQFIPKNIEQIAENWTKIKEYENLISETDFEIINVLNEIVSFYKPFLSRGTDERTRILRDIRERLDKLIKFILENTTYWGRTIFYGLVTKWRKDLSNVENERFELTIPKIELLIEPHFIQEDNKGSFATLLLKNEGYATATSIVIKYTLFDIKSTQKITQELSLDQEIAVNSAISGRLKIPIEILKHNAIKLEGTLIVSDYQNKLPEQSFAFTLEKDNTEFNLSFEDIPWNETLPPIEHLFKGREELLNELVQHYKSPINRTKNYILYGLTRTGKSSILKYLGEKIDKEILTINKQDYRFISFYWGFEEADSQSNAKDLWQYLLVEKMIKPLREKYGENLIPREIDEKNCRFKDWKIIITHLKKNGYFPIFLIDEFSYYKNFIDKKILETSFLANVRQYTFENLASFVFAGTYDIKELIKDVKYGITGQLVNIKEKIVSQIDEKSSIELIEVIKDKLIFTNDAIKHILFLTNRVPYFIQILCKYCGFYAIETNKKYIGFPEVEYVTKVLVGDVHKPKNSYLEILSDGTFMNNQDTPTDPEENKALITTIAYLNRNNITPRGVALEEIHKIWADNKIHNFRPLTANALEYLKSKEILVEKLDEGKNVYYIGVDLFRRFWANTYHDIGIELDKLKTN